jgi:hypothetical protein
MVMDRQKVKTRSESRRYRVADRLMVNAGRMVRKVGKKSRNRQGSKPGGLEKGECKKQKNGKTLLDMETFQTNWHRETGNTGINTLGKTTTAYSHGPLLLLWD